MYSNRPNDDVKWWSVGLRLVRNNTKRNVVICILALILCFGGLYCFYKSPIPHCPMLPFNQISDKHCKKVIVVSECQLEVLLDNFYKDTKLDYDHRGGKKTELPGKCLKNILIAQGRRSISLEKHITYKEDVFALSSGIAPSNGKRRLTLKRLKIDLKENVLFSSESEKHVINERLLGKELEYLRNNGLANGDDDLQNLKFLKGYHSSKTDSYKIPNLVHFVWFRDHPFTVVDYLCILSALRHQKPDYILFHGDSEPSGVYWDWLKDEAGKKLKLIKKSPPDSIFGIRIKDVEHQSDVARLQILLQIGGIYLDTDTMVLKSLNDLRKSDDIVLGLYDKKMIGNAAILAHKNSFLLKKWFLEYQNFEPKDNKKWLRSSMEAPLQLSRVFPEEVRLVEVHTMRPNHHEKKAFFKGLIDWSQHWTIHLMPGQLKGEYRGLREYTIAHFALSDTTYGEVARHVLWGDSGIRSVKRWILHPGFNKKL